MFELLADLILLATVLGVIAAFYFAVGRSACPPHDRLPLSELGLADYWLGVLRGWYAYAP